MQVGEKFIGELKLVLIDIYEQESLSCGFHFGVPVLSISSVTVRQFGNSQYYAFSAYTQH
jgi:hypothetical protein